MYEEANFSGHALMVLSAAPATDALFVVDLLLKNSNHLGMAHINTEGLTKYQYSQYLRGRRKLLQHDLVAAVAKHVYLLNPNHILLVDADASCKDSWDAWKGIEE